MRDFKKMNSDPPPGINAAPLAENIMVWQAVIFGPDETPWEGGTFNLLLEFSEDYPNKPPKVRFVSKVYHPNGEPERARAAAATTERPRAARRATRRAALTTPPTPAPLRSRPRAPPPPAVYADGQICLDILQNAWSPIYDVSAVLASIQSLLCDPNPNSPANSEAARLFSENRAEYDKRVRGCVEESWAVA